MGFHLVLTVGIVAPIVSGSLAAVIVAFNGAPLIGNFIHFYTGHALGNITFTPIALIIANGGILADLRKAGLRAVMEGLGLLMLVAVVSGIAFGQQSYPLLFLPMLPVMLVAYRVGQAGTALAVGIIAVIGGGLTLAGTGPIQLASNSLGDNMQFFQLYLAATVLSALPVAADLWQRRRLDSTMRLSEQRYRLLAEHSTDILIHFTLDGQIRYISPSIRSFGGHDPVALIGQDSRVLVAPEHLEQVRANYRATLAAAGDTRTFDFLAATADGSTRWYETHSRALLDESGQVDGVLSVVRDISARKATEQQLAEDASTDPLTGLFNRRAFRAAIEGRTIVTGSAATDCVAVLDLDHFKAINDSLGHDAGDEVLRGFARVARMMGREGDVVARIGGEEFAIFFPDTSIDQAMLVCDRLRRETARTGFVAGSTIVPVTVSGGVGQIGPEGIEHALKIADRALYEAKRNGRDQFALAA